MCVETKSCCRIHFGFSIEMLKNHFSVHSFFFICILQQGIATKSLHDKFDQIADRGEYWIYFSVIQFIMRGYRMWMYCRLIAAAMLKSSRAGHAHRRHELDSICFEGGKLVSVYKWESTSRTRRTPHAELDLMQKSFEKLSLLNTK